MLLQILPIAQLIISAPVLLLKEQPYCPIGTGLDVVVVLELVDCVNVDLSMQAAPPPLDVVPQT
jgi:hypothetical protein